MAQISQDKLQQLFTYRDGAFISRRTGKRHEGAPITKSHRYRRIFVDGKAVAIHRLIYIYHYGDAPAIIDHVDNDRSNNRIENLRSATQSQNCLNRQKHKNNSSGYKNVHWCSAMQRWRVAMTVNGKRMTVGHFENIELAGLVADEARRKYHGHFARG